MDHGSFDRLTRLLGSAGSRRAALGALLGTGALGVLEAGAAKKHRKSRRSGRKGKGGVSAQAVCPPPDNGVNRSNCDYSGEDFSGQQIHSSIYKNTIFRNAELVETNLSSSNMRGANFRGADLCGADLSSSNLRNADFRGFPFPGRETNLTLADLSSSACGGLDTNGRTIFCGTIDCNGDVRNDDCPGGPASDFCCTPCGAGEECIDNECQLPVCDEPFVAQPDCSCLSKIDNSGFVCGNTSGPCANTCTSDAECTAPAVCTFSPCCDHPEGVGVCNPPCTFPDACTCASGRETCFSTFVKCGTNVMEARRVASASPQDSPRP